jgi:hypothetical protein
VKTDDRIAAEFVARVCVAHGMPEPTERDIALALSLPPAQHGPAGDFIAGVVAALCHIKEMGI